MVKRVNAERTQMSSRRSLPPLLRGQWCWEPWIPALPSQCPGHSLLLVLHWHAARATLLVPLNPRLAGTVGEVWMHWGRCLGLDHQPPQVRRENGEVWMCWGRCPGLDHQPGAVLEVRDPGSHPLLG